jgi:adenylate cyclase
LSQDVTPQARPTSTSGRWTLGLLVGLVVVANLVGVVTVTVLLLGLSGGADAADAAGRTTVLLVAVG